MGTILASELLSKAAILLQDTTGVRWPHASATDELYFWLCDAQKEIVLRHPPAYIFTIGVVLTTGTLQTLPGNGVSGKDAAVMLVDVICNLGGGTTYGTAITRIDREILDEQMYDWHLTSRASSTVLHYAFDERVPTQFHVYPPHTGSQYVLCSYVAVPPDMAIDAAISLDDSYADMMLDYVMYRAMSKDADLTPNAPKLAVSYYQAFEAAIQERKAMDELVGPKPYDFREAMQARQVGRGQ